MMNNGFENVASKAIERLYCKPQNGTNVQQMEMGNTTMDAEGAGVEAGIAVTMRSSEGEKIALFRRRFAGRGDLWARRYAAAGSGKEGYSPMCANKWVRGICDKRCGCCGRRAFVPMEDVHVRMHLAGCDGRGREFAAGTYPLLPGDGCRFAGVEFGGAGWRNDAAAVRDAGERLGVPALVARSRSGEGAAAWWFFGAEIPARLARKFVFRVLTEAMEMRPEIGFGVYDRVFPDRDTMPKSGFGRTVELPLQGTARRQGNGVFVDGVFQAVEDPWATLASARVLPAAEVSRRVAETERAGRVTGLARVEDWSGRVTAGRAADRATGPPGDGEVGVVRAVLGAEVAFGKKGLPPGLRTELLRLAAFENPAFAQAQRLRLGSYGLGTVVARGRETVEELVLPRGCREKAFAAFAAAGWRVEAEDRREAGASQGFVFRGTLRVAQERAVKAMLCHDDGILVAGTAFGKTVAALRIVAERGTSTLILVNRRQLLEQWVQRIAQFLGIPERETGCIGGGRRRATGRIDVAMVQSLARDRDAAGLAGRYGCVVVDECHALAAPSFERVASGIRAKYVLGLSATPERRDGLHPLIAMHCGPVRFEADAAATVRAEPFAHVVVVRPTGFRPSLALAEAAGAGGKPVFAALGTELAGDGARNAMIAADAVRAAREGRTPIVLTDRRGHVAELARRIGESVPRVFAMQGGIGRRAMGRMIEELDALPAGVPRALVATGPFLGEGFDCPQLDTLLLAMPISWRGRVAQYAGRLHRLHAGKREVRILDYADFGVPLLARMFERRREAYAAIGYAVRMPLSALAGWPQEVSVPADPGWSAAFSASAVRLCRDGTDGPLAELFVRAAMPAIPADAEGAARARSHVEAFLWRRLDTLPDTHGRFELNARLPIPFAGGDEMEIDFLDRRARIAVEIDGCHHFGNEEAWRRDRLKDYLLQRFGYLVLRFFAADATHRLGEVLDTIVSALRFRGADGDGVRPARSG